MYLHKLFDFQLYHLECQRVLVCYTDWLQENRLITDRRFPGPDIRDSSRSTVQFQALPA